MSRAISATATGEESREEENLEGVESTVSGLARPRTHTRDDADPAFPLRQWLSDSRSLALLFDEPALAEGKAFVSTCGHRPNFGGIGAEAGAPAEQAVGAEAHVDGIVEAELLFHALHDLRVRRSAAAIASRSKTRRLALVEDMSRITE